MAVSAGYGSAMKAGSPGSKRSMRCPTVTPAGTVAGASAGSRRRARSSVHLVPFLDAPALHDAIHDEGIVAHEVLGRLTGREDGHRPLVLGIAERAHEQQRAPSVEVVEPGLVRLVVLSRLR